MSDRVTGLDETFGTALRRLRTGNRVPLSGLALMVHYSEGHLSKIENGHVRANLKLARAADAALCAGGELVAAYLAGEARIPGQRVPADGAFDIPAAPHHYIGRDAAMASVIDAVLTWRVPGRALVILVHGMVGVGKSAFALHTAHRLRRQFPGGCLYLDFHSYRNDRVPATAADMLVRLLGRLGVATGDIPDDPDQARAVYLSAVYRRPVLIVADNVSRADQVTPLVPANPSSAMIVLSRSRLRALDDCHPLRLRPLTLDDAVALLRVVAGGSQTGDDERDYARIALACGGLPLAVRVAAATLREGGASAAALAARLERDPVAWDGLDDGERSVYRALRAAVTDLPTPARRTLTLLALHPGPRISPPAAAWLTGTPADTTARELTRLDDQDLVTVDADGHANLPGLVRRLATGMATRLSSSAREAALRRLVAGYLQSATRADKAICPTRYQPPPTATTTQADASITGHAPAMAWCRAEVDAIAPLCQLTYDHGLDSECWRLAYSMRGYFFATKALDPWLGSHRIALAAAVRSRDPWAQAVTRNNLGLALMECGDTTGADDEYQQAMTIFRALDDARGIAVTLGHQAWARQVAGHYRDAVELGEQGIDIVRGTGDLRLATIMSREAALAYAQLGHYHTALTYLTDSAAGCARLGLRLDMAMTLNSLGEVYLAMRRYDLADDHHTRAAEHSIDCGARGEHARAVKGLVATAHAMGHTELADSLYRQTTANDQFREQHSQHCGALGAGPPPPPG